MYRNKWFYDFWGGGVQKAMREVKSWLGLFDLNNKNTVHKGGYRTQPASRFKKLMAKRLQQSKNRSQSKSQQNRNRINRSKIDLSEATIKHTKSYDNSYDSHGRGGWLFDHLPVIGRWIWGRFFDFYPRQDVGQVRDSTEQQSGLVKAVSLATWVKYT